MSKAHKKKEISYRLSFASRFLKRLIDLVFSVIGLIFAIPIIIIACIVIIVVYRENAIFTQERVGLGGKMFKIIKIRTMTKSIDINTTVTTDDDPRITKVGRFLRKTKIDELPQLINVLLGQMSFVGPRPDVTEVIDSMTEEEKKIFLSIRPGITGPATIKYKNEEGILSKVENPEEYNIKIIFPDKVKMNKEYIKNYTVLKDFNYIIKTIL
ncbi:MAG: sugar transferase [Clostridium sp.]